MFGGSGVERYSVARGNRDNKTVCCTAAQPTDGKLPPVPCDDASSQGAALIALDAGADRGSTAIHCELWTDGAAEVEVNADGYAPLSETLSALIDDDEELEECKTLKTKDVRLVLQMGDAGLGG